MISFKIAKPVWSILVVFMILGFCCVPANALDILIGTSKAGTSSHFTGRLIERVVSKQVKDINCKTVPASGDIHNLTNLLQGSLDIALIDSRMLHDAINKIGNFRFFDINYHDLTVLVPLYDVPVTLIVGDNVGITNLDGLKGKRINIGAPLSLQRLSIETILAAKNWSKNNFSLVAEISDSQSQDTMAFCHGTIDAMIHVGVHPDPSLQQLFKLCKAKTADMNDTDIQNLVHRHPAFSKFTIPSGTYPSQTSDIITFGTQTLLVASQNLDEETAYAILNAIYRNHKKFSNAHPSLTLKKPDIKQMSYAGIKLHAGTLKYFSGQ
ncbi:TAXI family TRAP transporter solute-binding subunit [Desulfobacula sp.]|uniref:TAXI family TRAP transporter solute-binding subunit n=1 Tax=Desulfobacula sp. TaxID=2593537 RepID=UPI0025C5CCBF|nr:TAXI family TRAP transporter solute-binding subunit [Desulfobacula sp.]